MKLGNKSYIADDFAAGLCSGARTLEEKICSSLEYLPRFPSLTTAVGCSYTRMVLPSLYDD